MVSKDELKKCFAQAPLTLIESHSSEIHLNHDDATEQLNFASVADMVMAFQTMLENKRQGIIGVSLCITLDKDFWQE